jgi:Lamin Tail Domain
LPDASGPPRLRFDPPASADEVTPVTRITVEATDALTDSRVMLVSGALSATQLRDLARPAVPQSLSSRAVSALVWIEADPTLVVVAPLAPLDAGGLYTLGLSAPLVSLPFMVTTAYGRPVLGRRWPDRDEIAPSARAAIWCGPDDLGPVDAPVTLEPALFAGRLVLGTGASIRAPSCVSWFSAAPPWPAVLDPGALPVVTPPSVEFDDGSKAALEPTLLFARDAPPASAVPCVPPQISFGPGCADVEDDRIVVRPGDDPILWTIDGGWGVLVRSSRGAKPFTLRPLPPDGLCRVAALDPSGRIDEVNVTVTPGPPRPHVVLNEVLANPAGAEPSQEWVELYNDGSDAVPLADFVLEDAGGRSVFPDVALAPASFALVVADAFIADDGVDPPPAAATLLVRVPALGRAGLSNEGEKLTLRDPLGNAVSTFPAMKTKNGVSIVRIAPDAPDTDPASFVPSPNGSATPGSPNLP